MAERAGPGTDPVSAAPPRPWGHPDLVLAKAVRAGVIGAADAELIGATRLGDVDLADAAERPRDQLRACQMRRSSGRDRPWSSSSRQTTISPFDFVEKGAETPCSSSRGRPRQGPVNGPATGQASLEPTTKEVRVPNPARPAPAGATPAPPPTIRSRGRTEEAATTHRHRNDVDPPDPGPARAPTMCAQADTAHSAGAPVRMWPAGCPPSWSWPSGCCWRLAARPTPAGGPDAERGDRQPDRNWLVGILAGVATLFLTIGGLRYLTAGGDPGQVEKAKTALKSAAIGYALAIWPRCMVSILASVVGGS